MSTEVAKQETGNVPALATTPSFDVGAEDVALPRLYIGQYSSDHVKQERVPKGSIFIATGSDDENPEVLWDPKSNDAEPVRLHVISLERGKSVTRDGELQMFAFDDPDAPSDSWTTYNYVVCLPRVDENLPVKWLLTRTGQPTAKNINLIVMRNEGEKPAYANAFDVVTKEKSNPKGDFFIPSIKPVEADPDDIKIAEKMATMLSGNSAEVKATGDEPAI